MEKRVGSKNKNQLKSKKWSTKKQKISKPSFKYQKGVQSKTVWKQSIPKQSKGSSSEKSKSSNNSNVKLLNKTLANDAKEKFLDNFNDVLRGLSNCTNLPLETIQRYWINQSTKNKEVCAVLAAIADVVQQEANKDSNTAYFSALTTALSSVENNDTATAVGYILSKTVTHVSSADLCDAFGEASSILSKILVKYVSKEDANAPTAYLISILSTLAVILCHQKKSSWETKLMTKLFQEMLLYAVHSKPKIRKAAQNAVCSVLMKSNFMIDEDTFCVHPAAATTAEFCILQLKKFEGIFADASVCHVLQLVTHILPCIPTSSLHEICDAVLSVITVSDVVVQSVCFQTLQEMFNHQSKCISFTSDLNFRIITALYDYHPNASDVQTCLTWLSVMEKALRNFCENYAISSVETKVMHISKVFSIIFKLMLSHSSSITEAALSSLLLILNDTVTKLFSTNEDDMANNITWKFVSSLFKSLGDGVKSKYHEHWKQVLQIAETVFSTLVNPSHFSLVQPFLKTIVELQTMPQFECRAELDNTVGSAIGALGPKLFLEAVPLILDGTRVDASFPQGWMLPLLKKYIKHAELGYYYDEFLPLAAKMRAMAEKCKKVGQTTESDIYNSLYFQCWNLLPSFCNNAIDVCVAFPKVARIMGRALNEQMELQPVVVEALGNLISSSKTSEKAQTVLSQFAKNFLPILFNIYTEKKKTSNIKKENSTRHAEVNSAIKKSSVLETIRQYLALTKKSLILSYFSQVQDKVLGDEINTKQFVLSDLLGVMMPYVAEEQIVDVYDEIKPMLTTDDSAIKAYKLLEEILRAQSTSCHTFVVQHLPELQGLLLDGLLKAPPPIKELRINCLQKLYVQLHDNPATKAESVDCLKRMLPIVILCTKDSNQSRVAAFNLIIETAKVYTSSSDQLPSSALDEYFEMIVPGLADKPTMIRATVVALSRLVYEFKDQMSSTLLEETLGNVCLLLGCNTAEIIQACLGFITVSLRVFTRELLSPYVSDILNSFEKWNGANKRHFRFKVKVILQRLVQKFDFETVLSMAPEECKKQLRTIQSQAANTKQAQVQPKQHESKIGDNESGNQHKEKKKRKPKNNVSSEDTKKRKKTHLKSSQVSPEDTRSSNKFSSNEGDLKTDEVEAVLRSIGFDDIHSNISSTNHERKATKRKFISEGNVVETTKTMKRINNDNSKDKPAKQDQNRYVKGKKLAANCNSKLKLSQTKPKKRNVIP